MRLAAPSGPIQRTELRSDLVDDAFAPAGLAAGRPGSIGGGVRAFQVKSLHDGCQIDRNETVDVDSARATKVLHHLTAMREVQAGRDTLFDSQAPIEDTKPRGAPGT